MSLKYIIPDWSAPKNISCVTTTRVGGCSKCTYKSLNLGAHVDDKNEHVKQNRDLIIKDLQLPTDPIWLSQVHGSKVLKLPSKNPSNAAADAVCTF